MLLTQWDGWRTIQTRDIRYWHFAETDSTVHGLALCIVYAIICWFVMGLTSSWVALWINSSRQYLILHNTKLTIAVPSGIICSRQGLLSCCVGSQERVHGMEINMFCMAYRKHSANSLHSAYFMVNLTGAYNIQCETICVLQLSGTMIHYLPREIGNISILVYLSLITWQVTPYLYIYIYCIYDMKFIEEKRANIERAKFPEGKII